MKDKSYRLLKKSAISSFVLSIFALIFIVIGIVALNNFRFENLNISLIKDSFYYVINLFNDLSRITDLLLSNINFLIGNLLFYFGLILVFIGFLLLPIVNIVRASKTQSNSLVLFACFSSILSIVFLGLFPIFWFIFSIVLIVKSSLAQKMNKINKVNVVYKKQQTPVQTPTQTNNQIINQQVNA